MPEGPAKGELAIGNLHKWHRLLSPDASSTNRRDVEIVPLVGVDVAPFSSAVIHKTKLVYAELGEGEPLGGKPMHRAVEIHRMRLLVLPRRHVLVLEAGTEMALESSTLEITTAQGASSRLRNRDRRTLELGKRRKHICLRKDQENDRSHWGDCGRCGEQGAL